MAESSRHRTRVAGLVRWMERQGVEVYYAAGGGERFLPNPPAVGEHEPDVLGWDAYGPVVGEVKLGPELYSRHTQEQFCDFTRATDADGRLVRLVLWVPGRWRVAAHHAVFKAGGQL